MLVVRKPRGAAWAPVMGATVKFSPIDRPMLLRARRAARAASADGDADEATSAIDMIEEMGDAMSRALIVEGAKDWRDVSLQLFGDDDEPVLVDGEPQFEVLDFSPENLAIVLSDPMTFEAFDAAYVVPFVLRERERAAPGNGSAALPNGIGKVATPAPDTANSRARRGKAGGARPARTSSTSRKPKPRKTSGGS